MPLAIPCTPENHSAIHIAAHLKTLGHFRGTEDSSDTDQFAIYQPFGLTTKQRAIIGLAGPLADHLEAGGDPEDLEQLLNPKNLCEAGRRLLCDYLFWDGAKCGEMEELRATEVVRECMEVWRSKTPRFRLRLQTVD